MSLMRYTNTCIVAILEDLILKEKKVFRRMIDKRGIEPVDIIVYLTGFDNVNEEVLKELEELQELYESTL